MDGGKEARKCVEKGRGLGLRHGGDDIKPGHPFLATALPYLLFAPAVINLLGEHEAREQVGLDDGLEPTGTDVFDRADELTGP